MNDDQDIELNEFEKLKKRATQLGIKFGPNIGLELLRQRVNAAINGDEEELDDDDLDEEEQEEPLTETVTQTVKPKLDRKKAEKFVETPTELRNRKRKEALKLVRVRIECMNPMKKSLQGEIFTVSNSVIGTVRKFIPYNVESDDGYHIPQILLTMLQEKKFTKITHEKKRGVNIPRSRQVKEFAIEILPPLTKDELKELATQQALARSVQS